MTDIFDLKNLDDLDNEVISNLSLKCLCPTMPEKVLALFKIKKTLCTNEIIVGYYRKYNQHFTRIQALYYVHYLSKLKFIDREKGKKGIYTLAN